MARSEKDPKLRRTAVRSLGLMGSAKAGDALVAIYASEKDPQVKREVLNAYFLLIFGMSVAALCAAQEPRLVNAKVESRPVTSGLDEQFRALVQNQAQPAWIGYAAIDSDPETEVKKRAVFALTQLPKDEGVPLLIRVARTNRNREARKQAMFWLGQSKDPRALAFIEEVLLR